MNEQFFYLHKSDRTIHIKVDENGIIQFINYSQGVFDANALRYFREYEKLDHIQKLSEYYIHILCIFANVKYSEFGVSISDVTIEQIDESLWVSQRGVDLLANISF